MLTVYCLNCSAVTTKQVKDLSDYYTADGRKYYYIPTDGLCQNCLDDLTDHDDRDYEQAFTERDRINNLELEDLERDEYYESLGAKVKGARREQRKQGMPVHGYGLRIASQVGGKRVKSR